MTYNKKQPLKKIKKRTFKKIKKPEENKETIIKKLKNKVIRKYNSLTTLQKIMLVGIIGGTTLAIGSIRYNDKERYDNMVRRFGSGVSNSISSFSYAIKSSDDFAHSLKDLVVGDYEVLIAIINTISGKQ